MLLLGTPAMAVLFSTIGFSNALPKSPRLNGRGTQIQYISYSADAINELNTKWYNQTTGLWDGEWWNSANVVTVLADFQEKFAGEVASIPSILSNTLSRAPSAYGFTGFSNDYYDDMLWWALGWIKSYDVTKDMSYLTAAMNIFDEAHSVWGTTPCGGLWWDKAHTSVNAVANALYITASIKLANRQPTNPRGYSYFDAAVTAMKWFMNTGMINSNNLINDGIDLTTCKNNNGPIFTYNQGIILSGLAELTWASGDSSYNELANTLANATISQMTTNGILHEACEPNCDSDLQQFKGIFGRNVQFLVNRAMVLSDSQKQQYTNFLELNADSIWSKDQVSDQLGVTWSGPYTTATVQTQSSALDVIVGAACVS